MSIDIQGFDPELVRKYIEHQLKAAIQDMNSMKSQSESLAKEYDRLDWDETLY